MKRTLVFLAAYLCFAGAALSEALVIDDVRSISAPGATKLVVATEINGSIITRQLISSAQVTDGSVELDSTLWAQIKPRIPADANAKPLLLLQDDAGNQLARFEIQRTAAAAAAAPLAPTSPASSAARTTTPATFSDCEIVAQAWKAANPEEWQGGRNVLLVLFNHDARRCYVSTHTPAQGDTMWIGLVSTSDYQGKADLSQCNREPVQPNIYISGDPRKLFTAQSGAYGVQILESRRCWDKEITITASVKQPSSSEVVGKASINFYERYRGTLQLGVLYTDLHENDFALRQSGADNVIYNKEADNNGPEYVASVVVYGLPRYFTGDGWRGGYRGRDILNEHGWQDRLGLTLIAGLKDPGDRFGVGLSFELAYGINLVWAKQWFRQRELVGVAEGDAFTGAATDIPTKRDWQSDSSFGLSFDLRYITALFTGQ